MISFKTILKSIGFVVIATGAIWGGREILRPAYEGGAGLTKAKAFAPARDETIKFTIWYPAQPGGKTVTAGGNGVFYGTPAGRNAPHLDGVFPLVMISHGAGGNAGQFGWIAQALAENGYVVALPNHPGTTSGNASGEAAVRVWERPQDVSAVIDHIQANKADFPYIDADNIAAVGFSAGGYTAMAVSGARVDPVRLTQFCDNGKEHGMSDCAFLHHFGIDLHAVDLSPAAQDLKDPRIKTGVIVDPGIISTITDDSLKAIDIPLLVMNLGEMDTVPAGVHAYHSAQIIPNAEHVFVPDATHFSFLAECKPKGAEILRKEGEPDLLCEDRDGRSRAELHKAFTGLILDHLNAQM